MDWRKLGEGVWGAQEDIVVAGARDVAMIGRDAAQTAKKRARICAHPSSADALHEMLIALMKDTYVRPHRHLSKSESFHIIEGRARVAVFDDNGAVQRVIPLGDRDSGRAFFYRINRPFFHTLLIESERLILHETTNGPFHAADTEYAPWAPDEAAQPQEAKAYLEHLRGQAAQTGAGEVS